MTDYLNSYFMEIYHSKFKKKIMDVANLKKLGSDAEDWETLIEN